MYTRKYGKYLSTILFQGRNVIQLEDYPDTQQAERERELLERSSFFTKNKKVFVTYVISKIVVSLDIQKFISLKHI